MPRALPNILISGTPGTGKTSLCASVISALPTLRTIDFGLEAQKRDCRDGRDEELDCWIVDEEMLADILVDEELEAGGCVVDYMHANFWPASFAKGGEEEGKDKEGEPTEDLVDLVVTLRTDNTTLYDRYTKRGYNSKKIEQNIDCEIMNDIGEENREYWDSEEFEPRATVVELRSDGEKDRVRNVEAIVKWVRKWIETRKEGTGNGRRVSFDEVTEVKTAKKKA